MNDNIQNKIVRLHDINPIKGLQLPLSKDEAWVMKTFKNAIPQVCSDENSITGQIDLRKTNDIINISGELNFTFHPHCSRCGKELTETKRIDFSSHQAPVEEIKTKSKKDKEDQEDIELTSDDMNFSFYEGDEIQIGQFFNDELALAMPYNYYCPNQTECQQAMPKDKNITINDQTDPRWAALKDLKIERK